MLVYTHNIGSIKYLVDSQVMDIVFSKVCAAVIISNVSDESISISFLSSVVNPANHGWATCLCWTSSGESESQIVVTSYS